MKRLFFVAAVALLPGPAGAQIFDMHVHLHDGEASLRAYEAQVRAAGLTEPFFGGMWFGGPNQASAGKPDAIAKANDAHWALALHHPEMVPIATVHPYDGQAALNELARVSKVGFHVLKIHPHTQQFDAADPRVLALVRRAGELGMIVLMDNAGIVPGDCEKLLNLALAAPKTKFIFAHLGGMNFRFWNILRAARTAKDLFADNIWFDISATVALLADSPLADEFVWTIRSVGVDHVLLGSDFPQYTLKQNVDAFERLPLTPDEKNKIRFGNAKALLGLGRR